MVNWFLHYYKIISLACLLTLLTGCTTVTPTPILAPAVPSPSLPANQSSASTATVSTALASSPSVATPSPNTPAAGTVASLVSPSLPASQANNLTIALYAWGDNVEGALGNGLTTNGSSSPTLVKLPDNVTAIAIAAGNSFSLAIGSDGKLYSWGDNREGELGNDTMVASRVPVLVNLPPGVQATKIAARDGTSLAVGNDGKVYIWGAYDGQGSNSSSIITNTVPIVIKLPDGVKATALALGADHRLVLGDDGKVYAWGSNHYGQLGNGATTNSKVPVVVKFPDEVKATAIAAASDYSLAIGSDGKLYGWGNNRDGLLGNQKGYPTNMPVPLILLNGIGITKIAAASSYVMALSTNGKVYAWGDGDDIALGNSTRQKGNVSPLPVELPSDISATEIWAGDEYSLALGNDGKLYAWGYARAGELGNGSDRESVTPVVVRLPVASTVQSIAAGSYHAMAILSLAIP